MTDTALRIIEPIPGWLAPDVPDDDQAEAMLTPDQLSATPVGDALAEADRHANQWPGDYAQACEQLTALRKLADAVRSHRASQVTPLAGDLRGWDPEDLLTLARTAGELWDSTAGEDPHDVLSERQKALLDRAAAGYLVASQADDMRDMAAEAYAACDHVTACGCLGKLEAELSAEFNLSMDNAEERAAELWADQGGAL